MTKCESFMTKCEVCGYEASIHMPKQGDTVTFTIPKKPHVCNCEFCGSPETVKPSQPEKCECKCGKPDCCHAGIKISDSEKCERGYDCKNECDGDPSGCYCKCHKPPPCKHGAGFVCGECWPDSDSDKSVEAVVKFIGEQLAWCMTYQTDYSSRLQAIEKRVRDLAQGGGER